MIACRTEDMILNSQNIYWSLIIKLGQHNTSVFGIEHSDSNSILINIRKYITVIIPFVEWGAISLKEIKV